VTDKRAKTSRRTSQAVRRTGLLRAVVWTLLGLAAAGVAAWILFTRLLRGDWPWGPHTLDETTSGADITKVVLTVLAGLGAAVALVVAYRRQRDAELARFDERFAAAAAHLGAGTAAERLAGVYAMAALADTWEQHRQQCIDVLCGYLRLPYDPPAGLLKTIAVELKLPAAQEGQPEKETRTYEHLPNDRPVRLTVISTITRHLRDPSDGGAPISWQGHDLDFAGATFDGGDFSRANFTGGVVSFAEAKFAGGVVYFGAAQFTGGRVTFSRAEFTGGRVTFGAAEFTGGEVSFDWAEFTGARVTFDETQFAGGRVTFDETQFTGGQVTFDEAKFTGGQVTFGWASFYGQAPVSFDRAEFTGGRVTFDGARFAGGAVTRDGAEFRGWPPPPEEGPEPAGPGAG